MALSAAPLLWRWSLPVVLTSVLRPSRARVCNQDLETTSLSICLQDLVILVTVAQAESNQLLNLMPGGTFGWYW